MTGVRASYRHGTNMIRGNFFTFVARPGEEMTLSTGPGEIEFDGEPEPSLEIHIGEREPAALYGKPVVPTLRGLADDIGVIIDKIERVCP